tara:strand:- start:595 stop:1095 length:501 start_codon:yes stop_codon:yes gene_type:complete
MNIDYNINLDNPNQLDKNTKNNLVSNINTSDNSDSSDNSDNLHNISENEEQLENIKLKMKDYVTNYCLLDDEILKLKKQIKEKTLKLKEYKNSISNFMENNCLDHLNLTSGGGLNYKNKMKIIPLKQKQTLELFSIFLGNTDKALKLQKFLKENREKIKFNEIKRF